uniref:Uncharacterized protein n=1 Tax=Bacillus thuringiensis TaxID=1428 RepID=A0A7M1XYH5_BACTU|nr:hypothetical protein [Bacillus thuringiensis]
MHLVAEGYVMWRYSAPSAQIRNLNINNINETKLVVERERLIGPIENPQLIVNLTHRGVNTSPGELQISHTFSQIVTNESSYSSSRSITNTFGIEQGLEVEFKLPALGNVGSTTTLKYEYSNTIENLSSQSKSVGWQYEVSAIGILPPHTSADLYTRLYKTKTRYEQTGYSYFEGTMSFEYLVDLPGAQWNQLTISLREIGGRINENIEQQLYKEYYMYFSSYEDPTSNQLRPALAYNGLFYLDMDDSYYAETGMTSPNRI